MLRLGVKTLKYKDPKINSDLFFPLERTETASGRSELKAFSVEKFSRPPAATKTLPPFCMHCSPNVNSRQRREAVKSSSSVPASLFFAMDLRFQ